ncbi:hypothetical protein [Pseudoxanthomonas koreensis]|uniref:hypothetical protein n=1 Tax=Pseudoxanthomonas koreensis TaxID=266061 RepID=UPI0035A6A894
MKYNGEMAERFKAPVLTRRPEGASAEPAQNRRPMRSIGMKYNGEMAERFKAPVLTRRPQAGGRVGGAGAKPASDA